MAHLRSARRPVLSSLLVLLAGCEQSTGGSPLSPSGEAGLSTGASATLLHCPNVGEVSATGLIDALGGSLRVTDSSGGVHEVVFPVGALSGPTLFQLTVPESSHAMVRVSALNPISGALHFIRFPADAQPTLSISYKRCTDPSILAQPLRLYHIHGQTGAIEGPFGVNEGDPSDPRVVGRVPHFSDYAVGSPDFVGDP